MERTPIRGDLRSGWPHRRDHPGTARRTASGSHLNRRRPLPQAVRCLGTVPALACVGPLAIATAVLGPSRRFTRQQPRRPAMLSPPLVGCGVRACQEILEVARGLTDCGLSPFRTEAARYSCDVAAAATRHPRSVPTSSVRCDERTRQPCRDVSGSASRRLRPVRACDQVCRRQDVTENTTSEDDVGLRPLAEPRPLSDDEQAMLQRVLELHGQPARAPGTLRVVAVCSCGCRSVGVEDDAAPQPDAHRAYDAGSGEVEVIVHEINRQIEELEIWSGNYGPVELPDPEALRRP
jgi:hypothetical protein